MNAEIDDLRHVVLTAPRDSAPMLDAVARLIDLGQYCVADEALDEREQVEAVEWENRPLRRRA